MGPNASTAFVSWHKPFVVPLALNEAIAEGSQHLLHGGVGAPFTDLVSTLGEVLYELLQELCIHCLRSLLSSILHEFHVIAPVHLLGAFAHGAPFQLVNPLL